MQTVFIDLFTVPEQSRATFTERTRKVQQFLKTLPGFVEGYFYERTAGDSQYHYVTTAVWENEAAIENAKKAVAAEAPRFGFNPQNSAKELGVKLERAIFKRSPY